MVLIKRMPDASQPTRRTIARVGAVELTQAHATARQWLPLDLGQRQFLERKRPPTEAAPFAPSAALVERVLNRGEGGVQLGAETLHDGDNGNGDASRDQTILDGGRAGLVFQEFHDTRHTETPRLDFDRMLRTNKICGFN